MPGPIDRFRLAAILAVRDFRVACHPHIVSEVRLRSATIEDLGSKNGTFLQGRRLTGTADLAEGDEISIGGARLVFRFAYGPGSTPTG